MTAETPLARARLNEIVIEVSRGEQPAEIVSRTYAEILLVDGTKLLPSQHGGWYYPGWSTAGRYRDRVRPDDGPNPSTILASYGLPIPTSSALLRGECPTCGQALGPDSQCAECR